MSDAAYVHPSAVVDAGAVLGEGVRVWHGVHVSKGATVGAGTVLGQGVYVGPGVRIGTGCRIQNHVSVYEGVTLDDEVFVGPSVVFTNVRTPRAHVSRREEFLPTRVERRATIGANATIVCGVTIGARAFVGAGAVVARDVLPGALVLGVPARQEGWVCECGEVLQGTGPVWTCHRCGSAWRERSVWLGGEGGLEAAEAAP